ncbi:hypothetical protein NKR23_g1638 [Pleurostoma richardsiae]|uniref:Uncharacterized protein n=1 Tax=Pleurostoma richardsiae TaxID=41990 RepID=A0AA38VW26_9PEZI|nr:hypothetical protein NKR23_g1638 [Pleurostoma richardsiae]
MRQRSRSIFNTPKLLLTVQGFNLVARNPAAIATLFFHISQTMTRLDHLLRGEVWGAFLEMKVLHEAVPQAGDH